MKGKCQLCFTKDTDLQLSHLIPKGVAKRMGPGTVTVSPFTSHHSSDHQFSKHLLCFSCEQLLHRRGENQFLRICKQKDGSFPLLKKLSNSVPIPELQSDSLHNQGTVRDIDRDALVHFGLGLLWKGSQGVWSRKGKAIPMTQIGATNCEHLRRHLVGECNKLPSSFSLVVHVDTDELSLRCTTPNTKLNGSHKMHYVYVLGVYFILGTGPHLPIEFCEMSIFKKPFHPIFTGPLKEILDDSWARSFALQRPSSALVKRGIFSVE